MMNTPNGLIISMFGSKKNRDELDIISGEIFAIFYMIPLIFQAIFGFIVTKIGHRLKLLIIGFILSLIAFA